MKGVGEKIGHTLFRKSESISRHKVDRLTREGRDTTDAILMSTTKEDMRRYRENEEAEHYTDDNERIMHENVI